MKLNPYEEAPRTGLKILGFFDIWPVPLRSPTILLPTVWNFPRKKWAVSYGGTKTDFRVVYFDDEELRGWIYLPEIDEEGNVKLC